MKTAKEYLQIYLGARSFGDPAIEAAAERLLAHGDALLSARPGSGAEMAYLLPAVMLPGITAVVSPDEDRARAAADRARALGFTTGLLFGSLGYASNRQVEERISVGDVRLLFIAPDYLATHKNLFERTRPLSLIVIDRAECIDEWGCDYRPICRPLSELRAWAPTLPMLALCCPVDRIGEQTIARNLGLRDPLFCSTSLGLDNMDIEVRWGLAERNKLEAVTTVCLANPGARGIVFVNHSETANIITARLTEMGLSAAACHPGLGRDVTDAALADFACRRVTTLVATDDPALTIEASDIRYIIHYHVARSPELYCRRNSLAGHDGGRALSLMFYNEQDAIRLRMESNRSVLGFYPKLRRVEEYIKSQYCRREMLLSMFSHERADTDCCHCDVCRRSPRLIDGTEEAQKALSAMVRSGEREPKETIIDILMGNETGYAVEHGYNRLPTFGVGRNLSIGRWRLYITQMSTAGLTETIMNERRRIRLTERGRDVLFGRKPFMVYDPEENRAEEMEMNCRPDAPYTPREPVRATPPIPDPVGAEIRGPEYTGETYLILNDLVALRSWMAEQYHLRADLIITDNEMIDIARTRPITPDELTLLGPARQLALGPAIVNAVRRRSGLPEVDATAPEAGFSTAENRNHLAAIAAFICRAPKF